MKTKVINTTAVNFLLKEGTSGVYRMLKTLKPKEAYDINVDANSTYREYWCAVRDGDPDAIVLSSDDCQEFKAVEIINEGTSKDPKYNWRGTISRRDNQVVNKAAASSTEGPTKLPGFLSKIFKAFFGKGT